MSHIPVMMSEVLEVLQSKAGETYIDGTFGGGSYTREILDAANCKVIALDRDPDAIVRGQDMVECYNGRLSLIQTEFDLMDEVIDEPVHGVVLDIGVSSFQIDQGERGFSFMKDGPLDMRMDPSKGVSASDLVNDMDSDDLANLIYKYGEERNSRRLAKAICMDRVTERFETTKQLADFIAKVMPRKPKDKQHPATRTFQALRIAVNDELGQLERGLQAAETALQEGGRLVVVTFHSLEDSIVKQFFKERSGANDTGSRHMPVAAQLPNPASFHQSVKKAVKVTKEEAERNPRARSAKLRWGMKIGTKMNNKEGGKI